MQSFIDTIEVHLSARHVTIPPLESPYCTASSKNPELICDLPTFNQPLSNFHTGKDIGHIGEPPHVGTLIFCVPMIVDPIIGPHVFQLIVAG